ncbi:vanadium-dependent haloperoxidase [Ruegeria sp. HKCCD7255]|uniref:vanadium-dependent haloperoxidase n=1 Tax=Ruegeria sp. HKCCD7255 TaxID=2683004 RepID=UPI0014884D1A|nr:vanadium-dependent haloperoxidase [Ruegeria sp. HKCCD7255]
MAVNRRDTAFEGRVSAAKMARDRVHPEHKANPDEQRYAFAHYPMSFTKGLDHDRKTGLVSNKGHFEAFRQAIDEGWIEPFTSRVPVPVVPDGEKDPHPRRRWEAPTAGVAYDLEGPDAQAVTMPPAPELCSDELTYEMAEVYELALLRDVPFSSFDESGGDGQAAIDASVARLEALNYAVDGYQGRPRLAAPTGSIDEKRQLAFRGSSLGVEKGPYLSQFMFIGNDTLSGAKVADGLIGYGAQTIDQKVPVAKPGLDYMQTWKEWLDVQDGFDVNARASGQDCFPGQMFEDQTRFICTPRDLATYVHFDALYQAYLNATLILLGMGTPFDPGFAQLSGMRDVFDPSEGQAQNAGGFALYGGPHILTLVTEVATRALKAVRFQKFNNHLRLRPEALAARMTKATSIECTHPRLCGVFSKMCEDLMENGTDDMPSTLGAIAAKKAKKDPDLKGEKGNFLLPMAFAEGSPMHPTYGAGHATVAGACTTIVKAFFDTGTLLGRKKADDCSDGKIGFFSQIDGAVCFEPTKLDKYGANALHKKNLDCPLTLEGELNKLASNISIGRNMAGVHYYSDYYDSLRMGEEIAIGLLEEQALCYPTDPFVLSVPTFDGSVRRIGRR